MTLLLNCDIGEKVHHNDALLMPYIDQASIACGLHASDPQTIDHTIKLAIKNKVCIGAHPSYPDKENFGRKTMVLPQSSLEAILHYQLAAFAQLCKINGGQLRYVKPHGALYNDMMKDLDIFTVICQVINNMFIDVSLMVQAIPEMNKFQQIAAQYNINLITEAFADRNYQDNGLLVPRTHTNATIHDTNQIQQNIAQFLKTGKLLSVSGQTLPLTVDSLCIHGDNQHAVTLVKQLRQLLNEHR
ncbi:5-oxoprolinase subunit PxpA [Thalassotalea sp. 1_MG-2023]|uniref:5-oxoprolinase subunit PxpA n=1 Tax=Thalassotalea sp. 1_MG-2023 TaxID=3062680 RepID=UPI0026E1BCD6|nr:5-oxoprolinase subunit PxpA [Thalassotalea sp. 1_MG-2023]MDO6425911.1 5-oxoprolinase subunit PxpA [Thalassotalea sp. 1_MG-2023]